MINCSLKTACGRGSESRTSKIIISVYHLDSIFLFDSLFTDVLEDDTSRKCKLLGLGWIERKESGLSPWGASQGWERTEEAFVQVPRTGVSRCRKR